MLLLGCKFENLSTVVHLLLLVYQFLLHVTFQHPLKSALEAATRGALCKKMLACNFIKKETLVQVFSCVFCKIFKNTFFTEHLWTTRKNRKKMG